MILGSNRSVGFHLQHLFFDSTKESSQQGYFQWIYSLRAAGTPEISVQPCLSFSSGNPPNDNSPKSNLQTVVTQHLHMLQARITFHVVQFYCFDNSICPMSRFAERSHKSKKTQYNSSYCELGPPVLVSPLKFCSRRFLIFFNMWVFICEN